MDRFTEEKLAFGRTLSCSTKLGKAGSINDNAPASISDCEAYGMLAGCDRDCPVLQQGNCKVPNIYQLIEEQEDEDKRIS